MNQRQGIVATQRASLFPQKVVQILLDTHDSAIVDEIHMKVVASSQ